MANSLLVRHSSQLDDGYCLPACAQMALAYLGISRSQQAIGHTLKVRKGFGTPAPQIANLQTHEISVEYRVDGTLSDLRNWLEDRTPVIAFVQAGELPHWSGRRFQHAVLLTGMDDAIVILHDPALPVGPIRVSIDDFMLAWDEMDHRCALITRRTA